jgi:hypothetical protein
MTIPLFEAGAIKSDNVKLLLTYKVKTDNMSEPTFLQLKLHFPVKGDVVSDEPDDVVSGTKDWSDQKVVYKLKKGQLPDDVFINLVIQGQGTVWIDDVKLVAKPL